MATKTVTDQSFATDVLGASEPVLVDFWAEWCGPCRMIAPALEEISNELGDKLTVAKLNIDENPETPGRYGVRGIPTMLLFKGGQPVAQIGQIRMNAIAPGVSKCLHLLWLTRDLSFVPILHIAARCAPLKVRVELDPIRRIDVDALHLPA